MKIICKECKKEFKKLFIDIENEKVHHTTFIHDCTIYEYIYQQKRIVRIEVIQ